jgi:hypothetical protein
MTMKNEAKTARAIRVGQLIAGTRKRFPNASDVLTLDGASVTVDALTKELQGFLDGRAAVVAAQATVKARVAAENTRMAAVKALIKAFVAFLRVTFGSDAEVLADFGLAPPKAPAPRTGEQLAEAAAKRAATRVLRGTKTPKQKRAIKANVTTKLVVTPLEPADATASSSAPVPPVTPPKG